MRTLENRQFRKFLILLKKPPSHRKSRVTSLRWQLGEEQAGTRATAGQTGPLPENSPGRRQASTGAAPGTGGWPRLEAPGPAGHPSPPLYGASSAMPAHRPPAQADPRAGASPSTAASPPVPVQPPCGPGTAKPHQRQQWVGHILTVGKEMLTPSLLMWIQVMFSTASHPLLLPSNTTDC